MEHTCRFVKIEYPKQVHRLHKIISNSISWNKIDESALLYFNLEVFVLSKESSVAQVPQE